MTPVARGPSPAVRTIYRLILASDGEFHAAPIVAEARLTSNVVYTVLRRLRDRGFLAARVGALPDRHRRYAVVFYRATPAGRDWIAAELARAPKGRLVRQRVRPGRRGRQLLDLLMAEPGREYPQADLPALFGITRSSVSITVRRLVDAGWLSARTETDPYRRYLSMSQQNIDRFQRGDAILTATDDEEN